MRNRFMLSVSVSVALLFACGLAGCGKKKGGSFATAEAKSNLKKIRDGAKAYFEMGGMVTRTGDKLPQQFPASTPLFPATKCCKQKDHLCQPSVEGGSFWKNRTWKAVGIAISEPHHYQYRFISKGTGRKATFTAQAVADPKCNGKYIVVEIKGHVDKELRVVVSKPTIRKNVTSLK